MSLVQCGVGAGEKTGSFAAKAKGNPVVALAGLRSLLCINIFKQTELSAQQLPGQIWGCCRQSCPLLEQL